MTKEEIVEMAKPFLWGGNVVEGWTFSSYEQLETFAKLVAAKEREACSKVCEDDDSNAGEWHWEAHVGGYFAKAIRARGDEA